MACALKLPRLQLQIFSRYLVDVHWMRKWKKYVGYNVEDQRLSEEQAYYPGPVETSNLLAGI